MTNLLTETYLPKFEQDQVRDSNAYKLLKENNEDTSVLEGYEHNSKFTPIEWKELDTFQDRDEWIAKHSTPEQHKEFIGNIGDFLLETTKDGLQNLGIAAINGADVATNLMPVVAKLFDNSGIAIGMPNGFMNAKTEQQVYDAAKYASDNLGKAREYLKSFREDDNIVSQLVGVMGQDMVYSIPIYNKLRDLGVPRYAAFFISGGIGGAIGVEDEVLGEKSTFSLHYGAKEIEKLYELIGIMPDTPEEQIADEVVQALEYGAFSVAIPGIIDAFKFMKRYVPAFAGGAAITTMSGDEAEANPIKVISNALSKSSVFKSSVKDAAEKKITKGTGEQIYNTIKNTPGVKESELKWLNLESFLKDKKNVSQAEVLKFIDANRIDVTEVMFPRTGQDFGMYDDMLQSAEQRQVKLMEDYFKDKGIPMNNDQFSLFNKTTDGDPLKAETLDFSSFERTDVGKTIDSFRDVNTFIYDLDAIQDIYKSTRGKNYVEFYIYEDNVSGKTRAFSQGEIGLPAPKKLDVDINSGGTFEFSYSTDISVNDLKKYAAEGEIRELKRLRSQQEGTTRYEQYTEPGGENYKELVFKFQQKGLSGGTEFNKPIPVETRVTKSGNIDEYALQESPHFQEPQEIAHVRFKTREIPGLRPGVKKGSLKVLSVEEMQSDLVQSVRKSNKDMKEDATPFDGEVENMDAMDNIITDFPFKNNWYELTLKRLIRYAADNGFDAISIPKGSVIQDRYGLTKRIDDFDIGSFDLAKKLVGLEAKDQNGVLQISELFSFEQVEKEFGKDVLNRIINKGKKLYDPDGNFLAYGKSEEFLKVKLPKTIEIGGEGKNQLYNKTIPAFLKKYGKKWNAKVYDDEIYTGNALPIESNNAMPVTIIQITPEMKKSVQTTSQPLFEIFGTVGLSSWGAQTVSDNMQNNIISNTTN